MKNLIFHIFAAMTAIVIALPAIGHADGMQSMKGMNMKSVHGHMSSHAETFPFGHPGKVGQVDRVIKVTAMDFKYEPASMTVKTGETVKFVVTNKGMVDHEFVLGTIKEQKAHDKEMAAHPNMKMDDPNGIAIPKGKTVSLIWTFTKPMTIQYACHVPGHYAAGMYGTLKIR